MTDRTAHPETYLGDGVYATFDGEYIVLRTQRAVPEGGRGDGWHTIYLDRGVMRNLSEFAKEVFGG